jgi:gas vesicle protein
MSKALRYASIVLAGGAVGAALGLLYAPASGRETRRKLARRVEEARG